LSKKKELVMKLVRLSMTVALVLALAVPVTAATINMTAAMDGPKANAGAGSGSPGIGTGTITFDTVTKQLSWSITWGGLLSAPTLMHFHGPALSNQNAGVQVGTGVVGPPVVGNAVLNLAQEADLLAGLWYLNLHTAGDPAGEIRGQVLTNAVPVQETSWGAIKALFNVDY
jgi:hypothetical protein